MKHFKQLCAACVLTLTITLSAFAGDMETTIVSPQQPPAPQATAQGEMETTSSITATNSVAGITLSLVQNVLALV